MARPDPLEAPDHFDFGTNTPGAPGPIPGGTAPVRPVVLPVRLPDPAPTIIATQPQRSWGSALHWVAHAIMGIALAAMVWTYVPLPHPGPAPIPVPPTPAPFAGKVEAVLVLPTEPDNAQAKLQVTPRDELKGLNVNYRSYLVTAGALSNAAIQAEITKAGPPPVVLWYEDDKFFESTPKPTADLILQKAREIRGK